MQILLAEKIAKLNFKIHEYNQGLWHIFKTFFIFHFLEIIR